MWFDIGKLKLSLGFTNRTSIPLQSLFGFQCLKNKFFKTHFQLQVSWDTTFELCILSKFTKNLNFIKTKQGLNVIFWNKYKMHYKGRRTRIELCIVFLIILIIELPNICSEYVSKYWIEWRKKIIFLDMLSFFFFFNKIWTAL